MVCASLLPTLRRLATILLVAGVASCASAPVPPTPPPIAIAPVQPLNQSDVFGRVIRTSELDRDAAPLAESISGGLVFVPVLKTRPGSRVLTSADLPALMLDRAGLLALAKTNTEAGLRAMAEVAPPPAQGKPGTIAGDQDEAVRLALPEQWRDLTASLNNHLIVAAPAADILLCADETVTTAPTLREAARAMMTTAPHPLSDQVLRWTPTGWKSAN